MTHYNRYYNDSDGTREQLDERALNDIREYLGDKEKYDYLVSFAEAIDGEKRTVQHLNFAMAFAGISGRPFHAFCRKYCLEHYKNWLRSDVGGEPVEPDEHGFWEGK
jgi:hypothetical protein